MSENKPSDATIYNRLVETVFSGQHPPGSKVVEGQLAKQLGVSRIPVRESLRKMVGQGLLTAGDDGGGIRLRQYTPEDLRQLFELRMYLEGGIARAATRSASDTDIARLKMICDKSEPFVENHDDTKRWGELDHAFHEALADASHNQRMATALKNLLTECHYLFYIFPTLAVHHNQSRTSDELVKHRRAVLDEEHRALIHLITSGDADAAEDLARTKMQASADRLINSFIATNLVD